MKARLRVLGALLRILGHFFSFRFQSVRFFLRLLGRLRGRGGRVILGFLSRFFGFVSRLFRLFFRVFRILLHLPDELVPAFRNV